MSKERKRKNQAWTSHRKFNKKKFTQSGTFNSKSEAKTNKKDLRKANSFNRTRIVEANKPRPISKTSNVERKYATYTRNVFRD